jgi:CheY-like chemotaxis protein
VLKRLKAEETTRDIPVVIISVVENRDLGVALGADDYSSSRSTASARARPLTRRAVAHAPEAAAVRRRHRGTPAPQRRALSGRLHHRQRIPAAKKASPPAASARPTFILLDLKMPGMSSFEVADSLKEDPLTANIPILVLTSKEISPDERHDLQTKVTSFVQKG